MANVDAALVQQVLDIPKRKREPDVHHHRQADDRGGCLEVTKGAAFCHPAKVDGCPARLNQVSSDGVDGSTRTASHCAMMVLFKTNSGKEPSTLILQHSGSTSQSLFFNFTALMPMVRLLCKRSCGEVPCSTFSASWNPA
jgi:hypothetical protein